MQTHKINFLLTLIMDALCHASMYLHDCRLHCPLLQEAQLPQRNSASAKRVFPGWLTDRAIHWTPQTG